jgi:hypothetical protein
MKYSLTFGPLLVVYVLVEYSPHKHRKAREHQIIKCYIEVIEDRLSAPGIIEAIEELGECEHYILIQKV